MTYTMIGTGNMAWFLVSRLRAAGYECGGVWGRSAASAAALAKAAGGPALSDLGGIPDSYDCCIVAVSDHSIAGITAQLRLHNTVVMHTAGAIGLDVIAAPHRAVLWLIYSILKTDLPTHRDIPAVVEANTPEARKAAGRIARVISDMVHEVSREQRQWLHLAAVMGNNFTNHLMTICEQICREQGVSFSLMVPILQQTFSRMMVLSPKEAQTGPAKRGDRDTLELQAGLLKDRPEYQKIYEAVSDSILKMYGGR